MISLDVVGIKRLDAGTAKISLGRKSDTTIYKNMAYLYLPWEMAQGIRIGEVWKVRPQALPTVDPMTRRGPTGEDVPEFADAALVGETTMEMVEKVLERGEHA
jgi:hypothetical protein